MQLCELCLYFILYFSLSKGQDYLSAINTAKLNSCVGNESFVIAQTFRKRTFAGNDCSFCPKETWLEIMRQTDLNYGNRNYLFINVGFNKGYNFATFCNVFHPHSGLTPKIWFGAIKDLNIMSEKEACGNCKDCKVEYFMPKQLGPHTRTDLVFVGIDLNPSSVELVSNITTKLQSQSSIDFSRVFLYLGHAAASNVSVSIEKDCGPFGVGSEYCSLRIRRRRKLVQLDVLTVDQLVNDLQNRMNLPSGFRHREKSIDILMIDTEGHDAVVLGGARESLRKGRVRAVIFEYHEKAQWAFYKLEEVVKELSRYDFACYFQGFLS